MQHRAAEHEEVPERVDVPALFAQGVEDCAHRVDDSAGDEQDKARRGQHVEQGLDAQNDDPAHGDVADHGKFGKFLHVDRG